MIPNNNKDSLIFCLGETCQLAEEVAYRANLTLSKPEKVVFSDGEMLLSSIVTVRHKKTFVIASFFRDASSKILETLIFLDSLKRADAAEIILILTYYGYARQDRKEFGRQPITAKLIANLLQTSGITSIITVDLHNPSIQGFFDVPIDDIRAQYVLAEEISLENCVVVSPDHGGATRARVLSELLHVGDVAIVDKRRSGTNKTEIFGILGNVEGKNALIVDDIIDTGGTIIDAAKMLKKHGAKTVIVAATHGVFSKGFKIFEEEEAVHKVFVTNTINQSEYRKFSKHHEVDVAKLLAKVVEKNLKSESLSTMYSEIWMKLHERHRERKDKHSK